ncbi:response regulator [uncultured Draconibacterium sp.]|uniref:hybrid sensor histidine kinase/response regulator transcription factor n=1 Tax=uncultured Draconibacterium sp. TaxID=1573823 RepID=UPI0025E6D6A7|nr:response regulator [uncultured Draconibacterium sp.]
MKRYYYILFVLFCFIGANSVLFAQNRNNVHFYNLNDEYDISLRETNKVCGNDNGFIWISSKMGIIRYTQDDIRIYQLPYETTDIVNVKLTYSENGLYAFTNSSQIYKYNEIKDRFEFLVNLSQKLRNPYLSVSSLLVDQEGRLWISTTAGMFYFSEEEGQKATSVTNGIRAMTWLDDETIIFSATDRIGIYNTTDMSAGTYFEYPEDEVFSVSFLSTKIIPNEIWIGTIGDGVYVLRDGDEKQLIHIPDIANQPVLAIENYTGSSVLIGIDGQGVWEIDKYTHQILDVMKEDADNPESLKGNGVYDIYRDKNNRIWVCTYSGGASYFDMANPVYSQIRHITNNTNSLINDDVNDVLEDSRGNLWFATNNGISFQNVSTRQWKSFYHNNEDDAQVFLTLEEDSRGRIWAGTYSSGVYVLDEKTGRELKHLSQKTTNGQFAGDYVFDFMEDRDGFLWIGGVRGDLIRYDLRRDEYTSFPIVTAGKLVDYEEYKLLICNTNGLVLFDKNTGETENIVEGNIINDIFLKNNEAWLCTVGSGVIHYDFVTGETESYTVDEGLPSNFISSIEYFNGYLWIATEQGLCRMDEKDKSVLTFNSFPGISNVSYNLRASQIIDDGRLMWGTNNGVVIVDPKEIEPVEGKGSIFLQELSISGRSIRDLDSTMLDSPLNELEKLSLKYTQNTITLEMLPIEVVSPGAKFSWKMNGLDEDWTNPSNNRILSYSNIPSGDYTLQIKMFDSSNTRLLAERSIELNVIPPFWAAWWFQLLVITFVVGLLFFLLLYYIHNLKKIHSEEKIRFFANTAHDIRTSLTLIKGPVEELNKESGLSGKGHHYLHLATEQTQRLLNVVTQLMDFQKSDIGKERLSLQMVDLVKIIENRVMMFESYAGNKDIALRFSANLSEFITAIDETLIDKVVDNLISNAIKYSKPNTEVTVRLNCSESRWMLEVQDHGIGISKKAQRQLFKEYYRAENVVNSKIVGSGIGLLLVKNYVTLHGGKINCISQLNEGSLFQVIIPVKSVDVSSVEKNEPAVENAIPVESARELSPAAMNEEDDEQEQVTLKMKVIIVEDNEYLREFLKTAMEPQFQVYLAEDGVQAWDIIQKQTPDLVVSDIMMPNMDGFELCRKIKSTYETSHLPIILLTALAGKAEQLQGLGLGADDYLTKPFDVSILQQRIRSLINNREIIREKALKLIRRGEESAIVENQLNDKFLKSMIEVVHENMANAQFSKNDFASAMNVSPSLLYKKIKSLTDQSPTDFIKAVRLNHALELLQTKELSITEVSEQCGFASVGYFSTVFRKHFGKSPTQMMG